MFESRKYNLVNRDTKLSNMYFILYIDILNIFSTFLACFVIINL